MFNIKNYLEKFSKNIDLSTQNKKQVSEAIERHTQIKVSPEEIEIKNYVVCVRSSPAVLNKIFLYKSKILEDLTGLKDDLKVVDIR
jgi:hypothetical protein